MLSDTIDFGARKLIRNKQGNCIQITVSGHRQGLAILDGCEPNNITSKHTKQRLMELRGETASQQSPLSTSALTPFSVTNRTKRPYSASDLDRSERVEIMPTVISDHNGIKPEINHQEIS